MAHTFEPDDSGLTCTACALPPGNKAHRAPDVVAPPLVPLRTAPVTSLNHPSTSHAAAAKATAKYGTVRHTVLAAIENRPAGYGATDDELEGITGRSHQSLSACRNSLMHDGLIEPQTDEHGDPVKRPTRHGNDAIAWRTTEAGRYALRVAGPVERRASA